MKTLKLSSDYVCIVDDEDFNELNQYKWCALKTKTGHIYAVRNSKKSDCLTKRKLLLMHRQIIGDQKLLVDHKNGDTLDNQKSNLRICTSQQNNFNRKSHGSNSRYKGIWFEKSHNRWRAEITLRNHKIYLGVFKDEITAAIAYNHAAALYQGEFARLNEI